MNTGLVSGLAPPNPTPSERGEFADRMLELRPRGGLLSDVGVLHSGGQAVDVLVGLGGGTVAHCSL